MRVSRTASRRLRSVFAYAPTAARWRGLPPAACSARPTPPSDLMQGKRGAWSACVTPGQRRTPYAWSSGLLRYPGCPRTSSPSASAGGKGTPRASPQQPPQATSGHTHGPASVTSQLNRRPLKGRDSPARSRTAPVPPTTANRLLTASHAAVSGSRYPTRNRCPPATKPHQRPIPATRERL